jgi:hypothetical protein
MKNKYQTDGAVVRLYTKGVGGENITVLISTTDLDKAKSVNGTWYANWTKESNRYYIKTNIRVNGKVKHIQLHRFIMDAPRNMVVDHINHDTLDNTRENLRLVTMRGNNLNKQKPSKSGHTNVRQLPSGRYEVIIRSLYNSLDEANYVKEQVNNLLDLIKLREEGDNNHEHKGHI